MEIVTTDSVTLQNIANAIREKTKKTYKMYPPQMSDEIKSIRTDDYPFPLNSDMIMTRKLCEEDKTSNKIMFLITNSYKYIDIEVPAGGSVKTSDGATYTENTIHYWDESQDIEPNYYTNFKLRWIKVYYPSNNESITFLNEALYMVIDGIKHSNANFSNTWLEYFEYINGGNFNGDSFVRAFFNCNSLKAIPLMDTSKVTNFSSAFQYCFALQTIPLIDISKGENFESTFEGCYNLKVLPELNFSSATRFYKTFYSCPQLQFLPDLQTSNVTAFNNCFGTTKLQTIKSLDLESANTVTSMFYLISSLEFINFLNIGKTLDISKSTLYSRETLVEGVLNNLKDLTGSTSQTLKIGATNLAKLTEEDKLIATNKNWILA